MYIRAIIYIVASHYKNKNVSLFLRNLLEIWIFLHEDRETKDCVD